MTRKAYYNPKRKRGKQVRDVWSLLNWRDLSYQAGYFLYSKSFKYGAIVGAASLGSLLGKLLGDKLGQSWFPNYTAQEAITTPLVFFGAMFLAGVVLMVLPIIITSRRNLMAQANDLNLMEDYKKSLQTRHLEALWDQVFQYESALFFTDAEREAELLEVRRRREKYLAVERELNGDSNRGGDIQTIVDEILALRPWTDGIEKTRDAFFISARYVMFQHHSQMSELAEAGFSLSLLEDWYDEHPFSTGGSNLVEQYWANTMLLQVIEDVGYSEWRYAVNVLRLTLQGTWHSLVARAITTNVGAFIPYLNKRYGTSIINSQILLWPGEENRPELARFADPVNTAAWLNRHLLPGFRRRKVEPAHIIVTCRSARDELLRLRRNLFHNIFGETFEDALDMIDRICMTSFELATDLRARYDAEYIAGDLHENAVADLDAEGFSDAYVHRVKHRAERSSKEIDAFVETLKGSGEFASLFTFKGAEALRAVKTAFHVNKNGMKRRFRRRGLAGCAEDIRAAIANAALYSSRLRQLRIHHTLTKLEAQLYRDLVRALAYGVQAASTPVAPQTVIAAPERPA